jgi:hypothetical protein
VGLGARISSPPNPNKISGRVDLVWCRGRGGGRSPDPTASSSRWHCCGCLPDLFAAELPPRLGSQSTAGLRGASGPPDRDTESPLSFPLFLRGIGKWRLRSEREAKQIRLQNTPPLPPMAAFNTATAAAALGSPAPCRPSALPARLPAARWVPLRCSPPALGLRRGTGHSRRGSAASLRVRPSWHSFTNDSRCLQDELMCLLCLLANGIIDLKCILAET